MGLNVNDPPTLGALNQIRIPKHAEALAATVANDTPFHNLNPWANALKTDAATPIARRIQTLQAGG